MKKFIATSLTILFVLTGSYAMGIQPAKETKSPQTGSKHLKPQIQCPIWGDKINKNIYVDYKGKRIYFCRESCKVIFESNPDYYIKKLEEQGVILKSIKNASGSSQKTNHKETNK